jgi:hypothetical protein
MKIRRYLPLLLLFSLAYSQNWKFMDEELLIKHKGLTYHSRLAKKDNLTSYYIYRVNNGEEEVIGDDKDEILDYKDLALASHFNFNREKILLRLNQNLEMFRNSNKTYKIGILLNKAVEELSEIDAMLLLNVGNVKFSLKKEIYNKYKEVVKQFSKEFMKEVINDINKIKSLDDLVKKLEEKIFNSTVTKSKQNIKKLESAKRIMLVDRNLTTGEVKTVEKLVCDGTIDGYSISTFQDNYITRIDDIGYQLTNVGSSMLKHFPAGQKVYSLIKKLNINGIEEIDSEALKESFRKMNEVYERVALSMNLYKKNFDPDLEGSNANSLIKELNENLENILANIKLITGKGATSIYTASNSIGDYSVDISKENNSVTFKIDSDKEMITYGWIDLGLDFKKLKRNIEVNIDANPIYFNRNIFYRIGVTDGRPVGGNPAITSFAEYRLIDENRYSGMVNWIVRLSKKGKLEIKREGESFGNYKNNYSFDVNNLNNWVIRIVAYTQSFEKSEAGIEFRNIKAGRY